MSATNLLLEKSDGIAVVTVNRPEALNALNKETLEELTEAFLTLNNDDAVRVIILTGSGPKSFIAGADISVMQPMGPPGARENAFRGQRLCDAIEQGSKPVIAAVNGFALGGGCEVAMACDVRIASESAKFGQPEINLGIVPGFGGTQRLPRLIGRGRAMELLLTGDMIDAREALRIGLVNRVVPAENLLDEARSLAKKIAAKGRIAVALCKEAVRNGIEMELGKACAYEAELFAFTFATHDQKEGMKAFLEKRPAVFTDN